MTPRLLEIDADGHLAKMTKKTNSKDSEMNLKANLFLSALLLSTGNLALAGSNINIIDNYYLAENKDLWKKVGNDQVPSELIRSVVIDRPLKAYTDLFPKSFYHEENFIVCFQNCNQADAKSDKDSLEQQNVYYWVSRFYKMAKDRFNLQPTSKMKVLTNRQINNPGTSKKMRNNAFFNPEDGSLTFLPATSNPLAVLFGDKLNRSGFDPSVIAHEAGHSLFHRLFPHAVNQEISGFNEGFADYMANILMSSGEVGNIMLRGSTLRDSGALVDSENKPKIYKAGLEAHDMGERFATALWLGRSKVQNLDEYDSLVISAIQEISQNPYAAGHDFKNAFLKRIQHTYDSLTFDSLSSLWDLVLPGDERKITDTAFLRSRPKNISAFGLNIETTLSEETSRDLGIKKQSQRFVYVGSVKTNDNFTAHMIAGRDDTVVRPYWILMDEERKNAVGAWRLDGSRPERDEEINEIKMLVTQLQVFETTITEVTKKAKSFSDLASNKGELSVAYKVKEKTITESSIEFNGQLVKTLTHKLMLKRKFLAKILGIPNLNSVSIITSPDVTIKSDWPMLDNASIIGINIELEDGTTSKTMIETVNL